MAALEDVLEYRYGKGVIGCRDLRNFCCASFGLWNVVAKLCFTLFYSLVFMAASTQLAQFELPWTFGIMGMASLHRQVGFQLVLFAEWASGAVPIGRWREAGGRYLAVK